MKGEMRVDWIIIALTFLVGVILCFYGYKFFRFSMAVAGFVIGYYMGRFFWNIYLVNQFASDLRTFASYAVPLVCAILIAVLSYAIYKQALFFISMFAVSYTLLKGFVVIFAQEQGITELFIRVVDAKNNPNSTPEELAASGKTFASVMVSLPGKEAFDKLMVVAGICLVIGAIAGLIICLLQEPAIMVITAVLGAQVLRGVLIDAMILLSEMKTTPQFLADAYVSYTKSNVVAFFVWAALIGAGIAIQFRRKKVT